MRILVTAFEPFGGDPENASLEAVRRLEQAWRDDPQPGIELATGTLPVAFAAAGPALGALVERHAPDAVLAVGEAGGRSAITPERWAVNQDDARIPDNAGDQPRGTAIEADGPERRPSGLDVDALVSAILAVGLPALASDDAGRFLCNHVAYLVAGLPVAGGFIHVPAVRSSGTASVGDETDPGSSADASVITHQGRALTFDDLALALAAAVRAIARGDRESHDADRAEAAARVDRAGTVVAASPERVYDSLLDANALRQWLAPEGATATIEAFDGREGGGFRAVLRFDAPVDAKSGDDVDVSRVTFVELVPNELVVQRVTFESAEERFAGDMLMTWRMQPVEAGTRVTVAASDVPPGISPADHELGLGQSLAKLAAYVEG